jgi:pyruvate formate lyase activating enzyme
VPGVTDDPTDLIKTGEFIRSLKTVEKVEVLAYHTLGIAKWQKLALQYTLSSVSPPSAEEIARAEALLAGKAN